MSDLRLNEILSLFSEFSSVEYQRNTWFGLSEKISSPDEMCNKIDDVCLDEWVKENQSRLSESLVGYIADFLKSIDDLPDDLDPWFTFSSYEWEVIRMKSSVIRELIAKDFDFLYLRSICRD